MTKKPKAFNGLKRVYEQLRDDAPEAAIGTAAVAVAIVLVTAAVATASSFPEGRYVLLGLAVLFGLVGACGYGTAIYRARNRRGPSGNGTRKEGDLGSATPRRSPPSSRRPRRKD